MCPLHQCFCSFRLVLSLALPPCWGTRQVLPVLGFRAGSHECQYLYWVVAFCAVFHVGLPGAQGVLWAPLGHTPVVLASQGMEGKREGGRADWPTAVPEEAATVRALNLHCVCTMCTASRE